jgi:antitoxin component of MazEF toxin-antitoxin module
MHREIASDDTRSPSMIQCIDEPEYLAMVKTLTRHGNSLALVIDKPILDMLQIDADTPLSVTTDGNCLVIAPAKDDARAKKFEQAMKDTFKKYDGMLRRLAQ